MELENVRVTLADEKQENLTRNQAEAGPVTLGVRPEHLHLADGTEAKIDGMVEVSEMMGSAVHLHLKACGTDTIMIVPITDLDETAAFSLGSKVGFSFNGKTAHVFSRETGENLERVQA